MANPFGWQQVGLKDTGMATQAAVRSAQQGVRDTMQLAEDYQADRMAIDKKNVTQQGVLNNREIANRIRESGMTAEEFAAAQSSGGLTGSALSEEFGINYDANAVQSAIDKQQSELVFKEIQDIAKIPEDKSKIEQHGVSGINLSKDRLMAMAQNTEQRKHIEDIYKNQQDIALSKQNQLIINQALGTAAQVEGGKGFGGLHADGRSRTPDAEEFIRNQANKNKYTPEQLKGLLSEYRLAEKASTDLSGTQQTIYQDRVSQHDASLNTARTHINQQLGRLEQKYQDGITARNSVDLSNTDVLTREIARELYKGDDGTPEKFANLINIIGKKAPAFAKVAGTEKLSPGRVKAIQADIFSKIGNIDDLDDSAIDAIVRDAVGFNIANYKRYQAEHGLNVDKYTELNDTLGRINNQAKTFKVKSMYNTSKGKGPVEQKALADYLAKIDGTVKEGEAEFIARIRKEFGSTNNTVEPTSIPTPTPAVTVPLSAEEVRINKLRAEHAEKADGGLGSESRKQQRLASLEAQLAEMRESGEGLAAYEILDRPRRLKLERRIAELKASM